MKSIDNFLQEDFLIIKPSLYIYVSKDKVPNLINNGMILDKDYISCYLKRLPEDNTTYSTYLSRTTPIRITISKLKKIKDQKVTLKVVNISMVQNNEIGLNQEEKITELQRKYSTYLDTCYRDNIPIENIPHIDMYLSGKFLPGFVCKALNVVQPLQ